MKKTLAGLIEMYGGNSNYKDSGIEWLLLAKLKSRKRQQKVYIWNQSVSWLVPTHPPPIPVNLERGFPFKIVS